MVFKQVHIKFLQRAVGVGNDLDLGGFCTLHASFADTHTGPGHMASQNRPYGIPKQGMRLHNGHSTLHVVCTPAELKSSETYLSR